MEEPFFYTDPRSAEEKCLHTALFALEYADEVAKINPQRALELWKMSPEKLRDDIIMLLEIFSRPPVTNEERELIDHELKAAQSVLHEVPPSYKKQRDVMKKQRDDMVEVLDSIHMGLNEIALKDFLSCACKVKNGG